MCFPIRVPRIEWSVLKSEVIHVIYSNTWWQMVSWGNSIFFAITTVEKHYFSVGFLSRSSQWQPNMSLNEQNFQDPVRVKVVVIGDMCVGKTAIAHRFTKNAFEEKLPHTVGGLSIYQLISNLKYKLWLNLLSWFTKEKIRRLFIYKW